MPERLASSNIAPVILAPVKLTSNKLAPLNDDENIFNNLSISGAGFQSVQIFIENIFEKYSQCENYVCNVGSGITPNIDPNKVGLFLQRLRVLNSK